MSKFTVEIDDDGETHPLFLRSNLRDAIRECGTDYDVAVETIEDQ